MFKNCLGFFGNPLCELDVYQIKVGFLYLLLWMGGLQEAILQHISVPPLQSPSRHSHPLVTERGGDPVNYRQVPHSEQWCIHSAFTTTSAFLHRPRHELRRFSYISEPSGDINKRYMAEMFYSFCSQKINISWVLTDCKHKKLYISGFCSNNKRWMY